jgi:hypothetical protein
VLADSPGIVSHCSVFVRFQLKNKFDVVVHEPGRHVHMEMEHGLACWPPIIGEDVETLQLQALHDCTGDYLRDVKNVVKIGFGNGEEVIAVDLWDNKRVSVVDRVDIENGKNAVVLIKHLGGQLMFDNPAKNAIHFFVHF